MGRRGNEHSDKKCPVKVLCTSDMAELCRWLCVFMKEARRDDWQLYTACSATQLLSGIECFINSKRGPTEPLVKLQDMSNAAFRKLQNILEHRFRELLFIILCSRQ